jgi:hypothetical protein
MARHFPGKGMTYNHHADGSCNVPVEWRRKPYREYDNIVCFCGRKRNDHIIMDGGDECGDGYYFAPKPTGKGSSRAADPRMRVDNSRYNRDSDNKEELKRCLEQLSQQEKELERCHEQLSQQEKELIQLRAFKAAVDAKTAAEAQAAVDAKTAAEAQAAVDAKTAAEA